MINPERYLGQVMIEQNYQPLGGMCIGGVCEGGGEIGKAIEGFLV